MTGILSPARTELRAMRDQLEATGAFHLVDTDDRPERSGRRLFIDLTFDFFHPEVTVPFLYHNLARLYNFLELADLDHTECVILRGLPFQTSQRELFMRQRVVDHGIELIREFYQAQAVYLPVLIARGSFTEVRNPAVSVINAVRKDLSERLRYREDSRFILLYGMDLLKALISLPEARLTRGLVVEGVENTLGEVYHSAARVAGQTPVTFDMKDFIRYSYPDAYSETIRTVAYTFDDMMVDLISSLF